MSLLLSCFTCSYSTTTKFSDADLVCNLPVFRHELYMFSIRVFILRLWSLVQESPSSSEAIWFRTATESSPLVWKMNFKISMLMVIRRAMLTGRDDLLQNIYGNCDKVLCILHRNQRHSKDSQSGSLINRHNIFANVIRSYFLAFVDFI